MYSVVPDWQQAACVEVCSSNAILAARSHPREIAFHFETQFPQSVARNG
jgi:hypothetical protein